MNQPTIVRALRKAIKVEDAHSPYDTIHLKIFYQSEYSEAQNPFSIAPAARDLAPFPVVIFFNGFNCSFAVYEWLAAELTARDLVVVLFDWLINANGVTTITPGVDLTAFERENYGKVPSAAALPLLSKELDSLQSEGILAGLLNLNQIVLGGHSAGGRLALENADPKFFDRLVGAFSYGAHSAAPISLKYEPGTILPLPDSLPMLLIGGTKDGVIAKNSKIYGVEQWSTPATPVLRTFKEGFKFKDRNKCLVIIEGANHFAIADRTDPTLSVAADDFAATKPEAEIRALMASTIGLFIDAFILNRAQKSEFKKLLQVYDSAISLAEFQ